MPKQHIRTIPSSSIPVSIDFSFQKLGEILGLNEEEQNGDTQEDFISFSIYMTPINFCRSIQENRCLTDSLRI